MSQQGAAALQHQALEVFAERSAHLPELQRQFHGGFLKAVQPTRVVKADQKTVEQRIQIGDQQKSAGVKSCVQST